MSDPLTPSAPHPCPSCGEPSYVGGPGMPTQCTSRECGFFSLDCWVRHVTELPDDEEGVEYDIEDEPTQPGTYSNIGLPMLDIPTLDELRDLINAAPKYLTYKGK